MGCAIDPNGNTEFSLTNSDSNYTRSIGGVNLSDIEYVEVLRKR